MRLESRTSVGAARKREETEEGERERAREGDSVGIGDREKWTCCDAKRAVVEKRRERRSSSSRTEGTTLDWR